MSRITYKFHTSTYISYYTNVTNHITTSYLNIYIQQTTLQQTIIQNYKIYILYTTYTYSIYKHFTNYMFVCHFSCLTSYHNQHYNELY